MKIGDRVWAFRKDGFGAIVGEVLAFNEYSITIKDTFSDPTDDRCKYELSHEPCHNPSIRHITPHHYDIEVFP